MNEKIIAVTGCPTGIAHTYMAEEALKKAAKELIQGILDGKAKIKGGTTKTKSKESVNQNEVTGKQSLGRDIYKHLMNGVSHMLPFVGAVLYGIYRGKIQKSN